MVQKITNNNLDLINAADVAVVDFNATWCGPCRMLGPVIEEVSDELISSKAGTVQYFSVDVDQNDALATKFGIMAVPTVFILKKGERAGYFTGFRPKDDLIAEIESKL